MNPASLLTLTLVSALACSSKSEQNPPEAPAKTPAPASPDLAGGGGPAAEKAGDASAGPVPSDGFASLTGDAIGRAPDTPEAQAWFELTGEVVAPSRKAQSIAEIEAKLKTCTATVELPVHWQSDDPKKPKRVLGTIPAGTPFGSLSEPSAKRMEIPAPTGTRWVEPPSPPSCAPARP